MSEQLRLDFRILGSLEVLAAGAPLVLGAPKERALLALLLVHRNEPVATGRLVEELWAGQPPQRAAGALQVYVSHLRKLLEPERGRKEAAAVLQSSPSGYRLAVEQGGCDADRFLRLYEDGAAQVAAAPERAAACLREALALWRGPALADFVYDGWAQAETARLEELRLACVEDRIEADLACGRHAELVGELEALIGEQPLRERPRGQLMLALYRSGRQAEALEAYQQARAVLVEELGIEPGRELQDLNRAILNQEEALAAPDRSDARGGPVELPAPATPLIGRERELEEVLELLRPSRLLTLTGPGGTGKTRLAVRAAEEAAPEFPDGVYWVGLGALRDPALVTEAITQTLKATSNLAEFIADRRLLLLLDNFEQLVAAADDLAELLARCPSLTLLVTSREPLHLTAEREYAVLPLREADAHSLFRERVRAIGVELETNGAVTTICRRLDHLPLAIELAAARTKALSPRALLERLEQRLPLLTGGARDLPERQRTLRSTISWSYDLLTAEEQRLFARIAVFAGFTLEAAEEVCDADFDTLQSLVEKSLLRHTDGRFWMLATIREFAGERLDESGEADAVRGRHAAFFVELADSRYADLRGREAALWLQRFEDEHDNFRSVLAYLLDRGDAPGALRLAGALSRFWMTRGLLHEGRRWLETTLRDPGVEGGRPRALRGLALIAMEQGDLDRAAAAAEEALELDRKGGDEEGAALALGFLADISAHRGDLDRAAQLWEECVELWRRLGRQLELAIDLYSLAWVARLQGELGRAETYLEESHALFRELEDVRGQAGSLAGLVQVAADRGDLARALSMLADATELYASIGFVAGLLDLLELYATVLERQERTEAAAQLWAARHTLGGEVGRESDHPLERAAHDEAVTRVRAALGDEAFARAWELGAAMTLDEAVAFALEQRAPVPDPTSSRRSAPMDVVS